MFRRFALYCVPGTDLGVLLHVALGDKSNDLSFTSEETEA